MFAHRAANLGRDTKPIAHSGNFAERHARLRHAEWTRIHTEKNDAFPASAEAAEVLLVRGPGVVERVVNEGHGRVEAEVVHCVAQFTRGSDERELARLR
jgi:hypothetical protein